MTRGRAVQVGSAEALFERPAHTFVGHFIGSPGMNFLPVSQNGGRMQVARHELALPPGRTLPPGDLRLGVRPEYVVLTEPGAPGAIPVQVTQAQDIGTYLMLTASIDGSPLKARLPLEAHAPRPGETAWLEVVGAHTCFYRNEELVA